MKSLLNKLLKSLAYLAAGLVILLAVAVGLFRLLLPRLPAYQDEIKGWATAAIGLTVEFTGMNARWRFSGPELNFYNAELRLPGDGGGTFAADEVSIGVDLMRLLLDRKLVVDRVVVRDSAVDLRKDDSGEWRVQDVALQTLSEGFGGRQSSSAMTILVEDVAVSYRHPPDGQLFGFGIGSLRVNLSPNGVDVDALLELPDSLGNRLSASLSRVPGRDGADVVWEYSIDSRNLDLAGWSALQPASLPALSSGRADLSLSVEQTDRVVSNAVIEFDVEELQAAAGSGPFGGEGRLEFRRDAAGWLLTADELRLRTARGIWPEASINVQAGTDGAGELTSLSATGDYLNLDDLQSLLPWLPARAAELLREYDPGGEVTNLMVALQDLQAESPRYDVSMELREAGMLASERLPGLRGFSGGLRANRSGGRVEIDASDLTLDLTRWLESPLDFASAQGTIIWRRNRNGITVLSDSVRLQNADLTSRSSVQLILPADGSSPVLDLESRWSVYDLAAARAYLPARLMNPGLFRWLNNALVAGTMPAGVTRVSGPLDRFPFDDGDGVFRVEAELDQATLRYSDQWPDVENLDMNLVVEGMRLYSVSNTSISAGNTVIDADIEIADLRRPVLTIDALATGTMQSVRTLAQRSPVARVFGGQLDRISVDGEASFALALEYPILDREAFAFTTRLQASDATLRVAGFDAPITELNGIVTVTRDNIAAEQLFGRFLGEPLTVDLRRAGDERPGYSVIAEAVGRVTAEGIGGTFGIPVGSFLEGASDFRASLLFPAANGESGSPFAIDVESDLAGLTIGLPEPLTKPRTESRPLAATIGFPESGRIVVRGSLDDSLRWTLDFADSETGWDFDRGVLAVGGAYPESASTRGLHIVGDLAVLNLGEWLDGAAGRAPGAGEGERRGGIAARIRSLDLNVQDLYVLGQHFTEHRVLADRSGTDWLVQVAGDQARGRLAIPYDLAGERAVTLDMQTLILPGGDDDDAPAAGGAPAGGVDPRTLPPVSLRAEEFALGQRFLGAVTAEFRRTQDGLVGENIRSEDETFAIEAAAGWVVDTGEPTGQRTWANATLTSRDVEATMQRLNYSPGIVGEDMEIAFDVSWSGGPREDFLASLDGDVVVRFGSGQLDEVDPGAGRMFGLLSVVALPRRMSLDFRDVLDKGFGFDEITGTFRLEDGSAYTCDLSLKGPAADIGIVGRARLVEQDYTQSAIVSANVGNTLPVVGAVVAGPQVAAALLIFSQIFKKPLQEMGQVYYAIEGSWDEPAVNSANAARFAEVSRLAGCLDADG